MNEVPDIKLCKELYELSGWEPEDWYHPDEEYLLTYEDVTVGYGGDVRPGAIPAYSLGYLLRKLPVTQNYYSPYKVNRKRPDQVPPVVYYLTIMAQHSTGSFISGYLRFNRQTNGPVPYWWCGEKKAYGKLVGIADTPEDAACKLCIELFKQGVITK